MNEPPFQKIPTAPPPMEKSFTAAMFANSLARYYNIYRTIGVMQEIEHSLRDARRRIRALLLRDRDELHRRLARRRRALMQRPPRAWCLALRASDRRIDETTAIIHRIDPAPPRPRPQTRR